MDVRLRPLTDDEFPAWLQHSTDTFVAELARVHHRPVDAARARADSMLADVLPDGLATERTWLLAVEAEGVGRVGVIWIGPHQERADSVFLYDIEIDEAHRGRGYGRAALLAAERLLVDAGVREIGLNVFGSNDGARRLYESLGYRTLSVQMSKQLG